MPSSIRTTNIVIETALGAFEAELYPESAPITVANFLHYVETGGYDGGVFHRSVRSDNQPNDSITIEVIQGGLNPTYASEPNGSIPLERTSVTGLRHEDGTISMARMTPDSAIAEFFICIGDQPELDFGGLRHPDGQGFAAFGRIVRGFDVVRKIQQSPVDGQRLTPPIVIQQIRMLELETPLMGRHWSG